MPSVDMLQEISAKLDSVSALLKLLSIAAPYNQGDMQAAVLGIDELLSGISLFKSYKYWVKST